MSNLKLQLYWFNAGVLLEVPATLLVDPNLIAYDYDTQIEISPTSALADRVSDHLATASLVIHFGVPDMMILTLAEGEDEEN